MTTPLQKEILLDKKKQADVLKNIEHIAASGQSDDFDGDVGPWMNTPLAPQAKAAWDRGMKRKKPVDRRDVYEKALDDESDAKRRKKPMRRRWANCLGMRDGRQGLVRLLALLRELQVVAQDALAAPAQ